MCSSSKSLAPEWVKAANALSGVVRLGAINMDEAANKDLGAPYGIQGFPTIKVFGADKKKPADYNGARQAKDIVEYALKEANAIVKGRLGGKPTSGSAGSSSKPSSSKGSDSGSGNGSGKVIDATESSFKAEVLDSEELVMVEFFAPSVLRTAHFTSAHRRLDDLE